MYVYKVTRLAATAATATAMEERERGSGHGPSTLRAREITETTTLQLLACVLVRMDNCKKLVRKKKKMKRPKADVNLPCLCVQYERTLTTWCIFAEVRFNNHSINSTTVQLGQTRTKEAVGTVGKADGS